MTKLQPALFIIGSGSLKKFLSPKLENFSTFGPPGYPRSSILAVLSKASPKHHQLLFLVVHIDLHL